jgi:hypothetical protein
MKLLTFLPLFVVIGLCFTSCTSGVSPTALAQLETPDSSPTLLPSTSTPTPYTTQTETITPPATLEVEQAKATLQALLQEPVDCEAPCFWGINPRQTTLSDAENIFAHLGLQVNSTTYQGIDFYGIEHNFDSGLSISVILTIKDEIVENLRIKMLPEKQKVGIPREWSAYSPEILIRRYGSPSRVEFVLGWGPRSFFDMIMYFDSYDLVAEYVGYNIIEGTREKPNVCALAVQYDSVRVWLGKNPPNLPSQGVPLSEATQLEMEEFSNILLGHPENACITFDGKVFP